MRIYVIAETHKGPCKIGFADDPLKTVQQLQRGNPRKLMLISQVAVTNHRRAERIAHRRAGLTHRLCGEWFDISSSAAKEAVLFACEEADIMAMRKRQRDVRAEALADAYDIAHKIRYQMRTR